MYCTNCGNKLRKGKNFCPECGKKVGEAPMITGAVSTSATVNYKSENYLYQDKEVVVELASETELVASTEIEKTIYGINRELKMLSSQADGLEYVVSVASGILCGMLDVLWVGDFDLTEGREISQEAVEGIVEKTAKLMGCEKEGLTASVKFLEDKFPLAADGNTPDFGGGLQHHLRDFAHHPTIIGLISSLLTQFTGKAFGTDKDGKFIIVDVPDKSKAYIGETIPEKIINGTIVWFFHLISDIAGSGNTASLSGGTGLPGPLLSIAKELSVLPIFRDVKIDDKPVSVLLSKLFNGTLLAKHDENGHIIKETKLQFDLRGEFGLAIELEKQALPVIANECLVRVFYFLRRLGQELKGNEIKRFDDIINLDWEKVSPTSNPTIDRMITVATGVFTAVDVADAVLSEKYFVAINIVGVGRFAVALSNEMKHFLNRRNLVKIRKMYEDIQRNVFMETDNKIFKNLGSSLEIDKFGLNADEIEILYNLELYKVINDVNKTSNDGKSTLKSQWVKEWKYYMEIGYPSFIGDPDAKLNWYRSDELVERIENNNPENVWFRLMLLEAMMFEPYFPLSLEKNSKGESVPSEKYKSLNGVIGGYNESLGDEFLDSFFTGKYYEKGYIERLRKSYKRVTRELNETLKNALKGVVAASVVTVIVVATAGMFAPSIAVALVGSNFAGLNGAALTSACLAYLGGGAVAAGGLGMAGGTMAIVGGGAILGVGVGAGVGGAIGASGVLGKRETIRQSAKLMVSVREIFLNDEKDIEYSDMVYEQYVNNIMLIEKGLVEKKLQAEVADKAEKKRLELEIKNAEESVEAMKIAMRSMNRFNSAFKLGIESGEA